MSCDSRGGCGRRSEARRAGQLFHADDAASTKGRRAWRRRDAVRRVTDEELKRSSAAELIGVRHAARGGQRRRSRVDLEPIGRHGRLEGVRLVEVVEGLRPCRSRRDSSSVRRLPAGPPLHGRGQLDLLDALHCHQEGDLHAVQFVGHTVCLPGRRARSTLRRPLLDPPRTPRCRQLTRRCVSASSRGRPTRSGRRGRRPRAPAARRAARRRARLRAWRRARRRGGAVAVGAQPVDGGDAPAVAGHQAREAVLPASAWPGRCRCGAGARGTPRSPPRRSCGCPGPRGPVLQQPSR